MPCKAFGRGSRHRICYLNIGRQLTRLIHCGVFRFWDPLDSSAIGGDAVLNVVVEK